MGRARSCSTTKVSGVAIGITLLPRVLVQRLSFASEFKRSEPEGYLKHLENALVPTICDEVPKTEPYLGVVFGAWYYSRIDISRKEILIPFDRPFPVQRTVADVTNCLGERAGSGSS